ncbi:hypothetical protein GNIT_0312 [Glaciecola nitratireducens FR1064]|uniref:Uncharacterized protein n=1 Tax=Glaciecola nitratireducens (strain JCM 12485 / KCTC 12276 / FR1064) TaxID=1085623 RepID=G4QFC2_GLANF|nr:hypothetical protein GNIT_0312 [Glaciecola nitratireducens FR1064]
MKLQYQRNKPCHIGFFLLSPFIHIEIVSFVQCLANVRKA